jgi:hypothetical protein
MVQVGKTFLAKEFINHSDQYLNCDQVSDKKLILSDKLQVNLKLIVLDEIHKEIFQNGQLARLA